MLINKMLIYHNNILIDAVELEKIQEFFAGSGIISLNKIYEYESKRYKDLDIKKISYSYIVNIYNCKLIKANIDFKIYQLPYVPYILMPKSKKCLKNFDKGYGGTNMYRISGFYVNDYGRDEKYYNVFSDRLDMITIEDILTDKRID